MSSAKHAAYTKPSAASDLATLDRIADRSVAKMGRHTVTSALALLTILFIPLGQLQSQGQPLPISFCFVIALFAIFDQVVRLAVHGVDLRSNSTLRNAAIAAGIMALPLLSASNVTPISLVAYANFAVGILAGATIGCWWAESRTNAVEFALVGFILATFGQLLIAFRENGALALHREAQISWGGSNYVAGTMVLAATILFVRRGHLPKWTPTPLICGIAIIASISTLSRGATLAAFAALAVALWNVGKSRRARHLLRTASVLTPLAMLWLVQRITSIRSIDGYDANQNIDARFRIFGLAWRQFRDAPLFGSGWLGLRQEPILGSPISFAHNVFLSFLQLGGLIAGGIFLAILVKLLLAAWLRSLEFRPALAAVAAFALVEPLVEGLVGALLVFIILGMANARSKSCRQIA